MSETNVERFKEALNLDREPFSDDGVGGLFYPGSGRQELLDQLLHLARYGAPLLFLVAENGVGKTKLVSQMVANLDPAIYRALLVDADVLADEHFLQMQLEDGFSIDLGADADSAAQVLVRYSRELDTYSQTPLLIIDSAQNLSPSAISYLGVLLSHAGGAGLRCLLVLDGESLDKVPIVSSLLEVGVDYQSIPLSHLDEAGCREYLEYRMTTSGLSSIQFNREQLERVYNYSSGNIDKINIIARQLLVDSFPYQKNKPKASKLPVVHVVAATALFVAVVAMYWFYLPESPQDLQSSREGQQIPSENQISSERQPLPDLSGDGLVVVNNEVGNPVDTDAKFAQDAIERRLDSFSASNEVDYNYDDSEESELLQTEPLKKETVKQKSVAATVASVSAPEASEKADQKAPVLSEPVLPEVGELAGVSASSSTPKAKEVSKQYTQREAWLLSLDEAKYTLQLLGAREEASVQKFLARYPSLKGVAYYRTLHKNKDWYVVVYGAYSSKDVAKQEVLKLPKSLQRSQPWARQLAAVQQEIRKR